MSIAKTHTLASLAAVAAVAVVASSALAATTAPPTDPSVLVFDQPLSGEQVNVSYAYLPRDGYIVIYGADTTGKPVGDPLGSATAKAGSHVNVKVKLDKPPTAGSKMWVSLYDDKDGKPGFVKGPDTAVWNAGRLPMENQFTIR